MFDSSTSPPFGSPPHRIKSIPKNDKTPEASSFPGSQTVIRLGHPIWLIISPAASPVKHFLPKFFGSGGTDWIIWINYTKSNDADNRIELFSLLLSRHGKSPKVRGLVPLRAFALRGEPAANALAQSRRARYSPPRAVPFRLVQEQREIMRKLIWCCSAAGLLAMGSFLSLAYYACRCPDSLVGRSMQVIAEASVAMQPLCGLTSMAVRTNQAFATANDKATPIDERIPDDPQPVAPEPKEEGFAFAMHDVDNAPIIIHEDEPMLGEVTAEPVPTPPTPIEMAGMESQEVPSKGSPIAMPYCSDDDDEPATPPKMPRADASNCQKTGDSCTKAEQNAFKAWMELFEEGKDMKSPSAEELPAPKEEAPQSEPKCQEDCHRHEHYSGCPRTTCPYSDKNHKEPPPAATYLPYNLGMKQKKKGGEESSEEPPHPQPKPHPGKDAKEKEECPRTRGVDTMEYRKSDGGLDEYGPGPWH